LSFSIGGCTVYLPQPVQIPLFENKKEFQAGAAVSFIPALSSSIGYSPIQHIGLQAYGLIAPDKIRYFQAAGGCYWNSRSGYTMELYGGLGIGQGLMVNNTDNSSLQGNYSTYFLQFNFGQTSFSSKNIDYGFAIKTGICKASITDKGYYESNIMDPVTYHNNYFLLEPAAFLRIGNKKIKAGIQLNGATFINTRSGQKQMPSRPITIGFSINYKINGK